MGNNTIWLCALCIILGLNIISGATKADTLNKQKLSWSRKAAAEAEAVASISCSGHGRAFLDGLIEDGDSYKPVCECNTCYGGPDCSQLFPDCAANADSGDPLFLEPFWIQHAESSAVVISGWHRMSYTFPDQSYISKQLEDHIRRLHSVAKNAVTQGKYIVYGAGSTQLLSAAVFALSINLSSPARVVSQPPFYGVYKTQTDYFETARFQFDDTVLLKNNSDDATNSTNTVEFLASPNNPDGNLRRKYFEGKTIYDHAYYWPHYSAIPAPSDEDLMIFTISKLTGHAGSRFGWAIVKDKTTYDNMVRYMTIASLGTSRDTQLRALQLFKTILPRNGTEIFRFAYNTMRQRWNTLSDIVSSSNRFSIQTIPPQFCSYFQQVRGPSPAYAWVKCEREEDTNCTEVFRAANIIGRRGTVFYSDDRHVRLSLIRSQDDFNSLIQRLTQLVSMETN